MARLLCRRTSQSDSRAEAQLDGSIVDLGDYDTIRELAVAMKVATLTADCMDGNEILDIWIVEDDA